MTCRVLVVDQVLTTVPRYLPASEAEDYALSMVFANAAARAARKGSGPAADTSDAFRRTWMNTLGKIGWIVQSAGSGSILTTSGGGVSIAERLSQSGGAGVGEALAALKSLATSDPVDSLAESWWAAAAGESFLQGALGTVSSANGAPAMALTAFTLDLSRLAEVDGWLRRDKPFDATSAAALFVKFDPGSIDLSTSTLTATLDQQRFGAQRSDIRKALGDRFADHYVAVPALEF